MRKRDPVSTGAKADYLIVKRGHHGRFRFAMLTSQGRINGEVRVDLAGGDRAALHARALHEISSLALALTAAVTSRVAASCAGEEIDEDDGSRGIRGPFVAPDAVGGVDRGEI